MFRSHHQSSSLPVQIKSEPTTEQHALTTTPMAAPSSISSSSVRLYHSNGHHQTTATTKPASANRRHIHNQNYRLHYKRQLLLQPQNRRPKLIKASEYKNLRQVVPSLRRQRDVNKVEVVTEAARYIDHLHRTLIERFVLCGIPDSLKDILGTDDASELNSQHIMNLVTNMAAKQHSAAGQRQQAPVSAPPASQQQQHVASACQRQLVGQNCCAPQVRPRALPKSLAARTKHE